MNLCFFDCVKERLKCISWLYLKLYFITLNMHEPVLDCRVDLVLFDVLNSDTNKKKTMPQNHLTSNLYIPYSIKNKDESEYYV